MVTTEQVKEERVFMNYLIDHKIYVVKTTDREIINRSELSLYVESLNISKRYIDIDFSKLFIGKLVNKRTGSMSENNVNLRRYFLVKDEVLGTFRIEDLGENYTVPRYIFKKRSQELDFIRYLKMNDINCGKLNDNFLTIRKKRRA